MRLHGQIGRRFLGVRDDELGGVANKRNFASEHFVCADGKRIQVSALVDDLPRDLLGRHVFGCPHKEARFGEAPCFVVTRHRNSEVGQEDAAVLVDEDVLGLDIAVDRSLCVCIIECQCDRADQDGNDFARQRTTFADDGIDAPPIDELHGEVLNTLGFADVEQGHDVWVLQTCDDFAFAAKSGRKFGIAGKLWGKHFECNRPAKYGVGGAVDPCHPATTDLGMYFVAFEASPDEIQHGAPLNSTTMWYNRRNYGHCNI